MWDVASLVVSSIAVSLTPQQRWQAAGRFGSNIFTIWLFVAAGAIAIALLAAVVLVTTYRRRNGKNAKREDHFFEQATKAGLSRRESGLLINIARVIGLKQAESIFTMSNAFDSGAAMLADEALASRMTPEQSRQLRAEMSSLREKLGFRKHSAAAASAAGGSHKPSSREIPVGKKLHMTRRITRESQDIEAEVINNTDTELTVKLGVRAESSPQEQWRIRYYFGASVWEFEVSVISCENNVLVLNHSDKIRFINRRRFLRVPVRKKAYMAVFPFEKKVAVRKAEESTETSNEFDSGTVLPQFVPATVTELAGPGMRIQCPLELKVGQRVAIVLNLSIETEFHNGNLKESSAAISTVVQDIGQVRHVKPADDGWSIAVELTGLGDSDVDELIRATNAAAVEAKEHGESAEEPAGEGEVVTAATTSEEA